MSALREPILVTVRPADVLAAMTDEQLIALWGLVYGAATGDTDAEFLAAFRGALRSRGDVGNAS